MTAVSDETGRGWLPLKYEDGPDFCTVTFATGAAFALTVHPERMKLMEAALSASPVAAWKCAALKQSFPEPADCGWPTCGCDPHADKVIAALEEQGHASPVAQEPVATAPVSPDVWTRRVVREAMQDAWNDICHDTGCHPIDIRNVNGVVFFEPRHWAEQVASLLFNRTVRDNLAPTPPATSATQEPFGYVIEVFGQELFFTAKYHDAARFYEKGGARKITVYTQQATPAGLGAEDIARFARMVGALLRHINPVNVAENFGQQWHAVHDEQQRILALLSRGSGIRSDATHEEQSTQSI